jgi:PAS domain S-box-containing protein
MIYAHSPNVSEGSAAFFMNIGSIGWVSFSSFFLWFVLIFTKKEKILNIKLIYLFLLGLPLLFIYKQWTGCLITDFTRSTYWTVGTWAESIWPPLFSVYYFSFMGLGLYLVFNFARKTKNALKKKQSKIIFSTVFITLILASLTDVILPEWRIFIIPPAGDFAAVIWAFGIAYAMSRYQFLSITPAMAADSVFATITDALFLLDGNGRVAIVNRASEELTGYDEGELKGASLGSLIGGEIFNRTLIDRLKKGDTVNRHDVNLKTKHGAEIPVRFSGSAMVEDGGFAGAVCIISDITMYKKAEEVLRENQEKLKGQAESLEASLEEAEKSRRIMISMLDDNNQIRTVLEEKLNELSETQDRLLQSEKLASLGKLVSDMAHEVNNPLQIISGRAQLALIELAEGLEKEKDEFKNNLDIIVDQCMRAKDIILRLLSFSKPSRGEIKETNINDSVEFIVKLIEHQFLLSKVKIIRKYDSSLPPAEMDEKQIHEVFMNLLKNAAEAMPDGGIITISTKVEGGNARVDFKDTGSGISREDMRKIFDPFFTTKESGTGLGLSVCYGIVKSHGGELKYQSDPGKGTTATILLPLKGK